MNTHYRDRATFLMVYIREAHASDEWVTPDNRWLADISIEQPKTFEERKKVAALCNETFDISFSVVVDDIGDTTNKLYGAWPERLYIIGADGKVVYQGGYGPFGFKPKQMEKALRRLLQKPQV